MWCLGRNYSNVYLNMWWQKWTSLCIWREKAWPVMIFWTTWGQWVDQPSKYNSQLFKALELLQNVSTYGLRFQHKPFLENYNFYFLKIVWRLKSPCFGNVPSSLFQTATITTNVVSSVNNSVQIFLLCFRRGHHHLRTTTFPYHSLLLSSFIEKLAHWVQWSLLWKIYR